MAGKGVTEVDRAALAKIIGVTLRHMHNLDQAGMPSRADGKRRWYDLAAAVQWYVGYREALARPEQSELDQAKLERAQLDVRKKQIEVALAEGKAVDMEHHVEVLGTVLDRMRAKQLSLPGTWGPRIVGLRTPAEGTDVMRTIAEESIRDLRSIADEIDFGAAGDIPEDFPGANALVSAGVKTVSDIQEIGDLTAVHGIGPATARRIRAEIGGVA